MQIILFTKYSLYWIWMQNSSPAEQNEVGYKNVINPVAILWSHYISPNYTYIYRNSFEFDESNTYSL